MRTKHWSGNQKCIRKPETLRWRDVKSVLIQNRFRKCIAREQRTWSWASAAEINAKKGESREGQGEMNDRRQRKLRQFFLNSKSTSKIGFEQTLKCKQTTANPANRSAAKFNLQKIGILLCLRKVAETNQKMKSRRWEDFLWSFDLNCFQKPVWAGAQLQVVTAVRAITGRRRWTVKVIGNESQIQWGLK